MNSTHKNHTNPLLKKTIVLTRAEAQKGEAHERLKALGATVKDLPALIIGPPENWDPLDNALKQLDLFDWIVFSSANGVSAVEGRLKLIGKTLSRLPSKLKIAAVGRKTAIYLNKLGVSVDFIPPKFIADSLVEHFPSSGLAEKILLPRVQSGGRTILSEGLMKAGLKVTEIAAYESFCPENIPDETLAVLNNFGVDVIAFTSGKTVSNTVHLLEREFGNKYHDLIGNVKIVSIGPQTSLSCRKHFQRVDKEASPHDLDGLINACIELYSLNK